MRHYVNLIVLFLIAFIFLQILNYFELPFYMVLCALPIYVYVILYIINRFNYRKSLDFQPIPPDRLERGLKSPGRNYKLIKESGFRKFDEFYLKLSNELVVIAYFHEEYPIILCDYRIANKNFFDLVSKFENGYTLTTSNAENSGLIPRGKNKLLQVFDKREVNVLLLQHLNTIEFLESRSNKVLPLNLIEFRDWFMSSYRNDGEKINNLLGPIKLLYWSVTNHKQKYLKSLQEQFLAKTQNLQ